MNISVNPIATTNFAGGFVASSYGLVQGTVMADPATRFALANGVLAGTETLPMWGGVGIFENVPLATTGSTSGALGGNVGRALSLAALTGFCVFDQAYAMINTPQSPVPLAANLMSINFFRLGSGARLSVACDPALINLDGGLITQQVSWDFVGQKLVAFSPTYADLPVSAIAWSAGVVTVTTTSANTLITGNNVELSGFTPAGYNGQFDIIVTDTTHFTFPLAVNPGGSSVLGVVKGGGGVLPCKILRVAAGNSKTVVYDPVTGFATWNPSGTAALIQI